jgi:hypothetical protein
MEIKTPRRVSEFLSLLKLVTVNVFNLFSIYNTEQIYFILFINDPYDYPFFLMKNKN